MANSETRVGTNIAAGSGDLVMPAGLRSELDDHLDKLRYQYRDRGWGGRVGLGSKPAVIVLDLALAWTTVRGPIGANLDAVVEATCRVLRAARSADIPIFFTTGRFDPADVPGPGARKLALRPLDGFSMEEQFRLDPRLERRPNERIIEKPYFSAFKGTNFQEALTAAGVDTLIVTGCSTSHCVYATCRDARDSFRVIVPEEAVGDRSELMHKVFLFDIDLALGDVVPVDDVETWLARATEQVTGSR
jgi:nicotinamidase-related amidase